MKPPSAEEEAKADDERKALRASAPFETRPNPHKGPQVKKLPTCKVKILI